MGSAKEKSAGARTYHGVPAGGARGSVGVDALSVVSAAGAGGGVEGGEGRIAPRKGKAQKNAATRESAKGRTVSTGKHARGGRLTTGWCPHKEKTRLRLFLHEHFTH